jgi:hypothetical protein
MSSGRNDGAAEELAVFVGWEGPSGIRVTSGRRGKEFSKAKGPKLTGDGVCHRKREVGDECHGRRGKGILGVV